MNVVVDLQIWLLRSNHFVIQLRDHYSYLARPRKSFCDCGIRPSLIDRRALPFVHRVNPEREPCWRVSKLSPIVQ
jgi:hypothetical protein